jgi:hypothetical protein
MLFMVLGPWMSPSMYALQALVLVALAAYLWRSFFESKPPL